MKSAHSPLPWGMKPSSFDDELLILCDETCIATVPVWEDDDSDALRTEAHANAAFIVRACNAHDELVVALKLALDALNTAPRFRAGGTDSYQIASRIEAALKLAEINPYDS